MCISTLFNGNPTKNPRTPLLLSTSVTLLRTSLEWKYHGDWTVPPVKPLFTFQILFSSRETSTHHREQRYSLWTGPCSELGTMPVQSTAVFLNTLCELYEPAVMCSKRRKEIGLYLTNIFKRQHFWVKE